jgi:hypothetical protein
MLDLGFREVSLIWPPGGIATAAVLILGVRASPALVEELTAIDVVGLPGHERSLIGCEEDNQICHILRLGDPTERDSLGHLVQHAPAELVERAPLFLGPGSFPIVETSSVHRPRADGIHRDPGGSKIERCRLREAYNRELRRRVRGHVTARLTRLIGSDVDDSRLF